LLGMKEMGLGGAPDDKQGGAGWMNLWTLFYWGWWISWAPFVGCFMAKISRGRTLRQFIFGTLIIPSMYSFFWFAAFGGEAIRIQRIADTVSLCNNWKDPSLCDLKHVEAECNGDYCGRSPPTCSHYAAAYSLEQKKTMNMGFTPSCVLDGKSGKCKMFEWTHLAKVGSSCVEITEFKTVPCGTTAADPTAAALPCAGLTGDDLAACQKNNPCYGKITDAQLAGASKTFNHFDATKNPECFVPVEDGITCLWNQATADVWFDLMDYFLDSKGMSYLFSVISIATLILYFVTSSDSGSLCTS
jgi:hypothetical protein